MRSFVLILLMAAFVAAQPVVFSAGGTVTPPPGQLGYYPAGGPGAYAPTVTAVPTNIPALPPTFEAAVGDFAGFGFINSSAVDVSVQSLGGYVDNVLSFELNVYESHLTASCGMPAACTVDAGSTFAVLYARGASGSGTVATTVGNIIADASGAPILPLCTFEIAPAMAFGIPSWTTEQGGPGVGPFPLPTHAGRGTVCQIRSGYDYVAGLPLAGFVVDVDALLFVPSGPGASSGYYAFTGPHVTVTL